MREKSDTATLTSKALFDNPVYHLINITKKRDHPPNGEQLQCKYCSNVYSYGVSLFSHTKMKHGDLLPKKSRGRPKKCQRGRPKKCIKKLPLEADNDITGKPTQSEALPTFTFEQQVISLYHSTKSQKPLHSHLQEILEFTLVKQ